MAHARLVQLPMNVTFRGARSREALLIEGPYGWGEWAPFWEYPPEEAANWLVAAVEGAYLPAPDVLREWVPVNATVPAVGPDEVPGILARYPGVRCVKVKVAQPGQSLADDVARVNAVREALPGAAIRVDANGAWTIDEALQACRELGPLEYLEQPTADLAELRRMCARNGIWAQIAADEDIRRAEDPFRVARERSADVGVLKVAPLGGIRNTVGVMDELHAHGVKSVIASALDTAVGIGLSTLALAQMEQHVDDDEMIVDLPPAGLATGVFFEEDVANHEIVDGCIRVGRVTPDFSRVAPADPGREAAWLERLAAAYRVLERWN